MFILIIWVIALSGLAVSFFRNRAKTSQSLKVTWRFFRSIAIPILMVIWIIGFLLAFMPEDLLSKTVGPESGLLGTVIAALFGAVVLIQAFIAFPLSGSLLRDGASVSAIAAFVTTLVMVGVVTAPVEAKFFGKAFTFWRNSLSFLFALIIAFIMGVILG